MITFFDMFQSKAGKKYEFEIQGCCGGEGVKCGFLSCDAVNNIMEE